MKSTSIALCCSLAFLATTDLARAATRFEPLRLVSRVDPAVTRSATPNGDSFGMQMAPDGAWLLFLSDAHDVTTNRHHDGFLDLYWYDRTAQTTTLISVDSAGAAGGDAHTSVGRATPDGRYVAFDSEARNLVPGVDTNYSSDVFVRDVVAGTTRLVSVNRHGTEPGLGGSVDPEITPDGRYLAFTSTAEDLVDGDTNGLADVFVRDLFESTTECVTLGSASPIFSPGFFYGSGGPRLSADARWLAFSSTATNLVAGVTNLYGEIYLRDRLQGTTICPSEVVFDEWPLPEGATLFRRRAFNPAISEDGKYLAFVVERLSKPQTSEHPRSLWRFEIASGQATLVTTNLTLSEFVESTIFTMTPDGRWLAYQTAALDNRNDIELWDGDTGVTLLATPALDGISGADGFCDMPELSADGRFLVFTSNAGNLVTNGIDASSNVFVRDTVAAQTELISRDPAGIGLGGSDLSFPGISHDGALVVFDSFSSGHVPDDRNLASDVFLRHREAGVTELVSRADPRAQSISGSGHSSLGASPFSEDGERLLFRSESDDLAAAGTPPGLGQLYVHDLASGTNALVSVNLEGNGGGNAWCYEQVISGDGRSVVFSTAADNLVAGDDNARQDVFLRDLEARSTLLLSRASGSAASANDTSGFPAISRDGNRIAFLSYATDLVEPVINVNHLEAYLHDRPTHSTVRITDPRETSVDASPPRVSPGGRYFTYANQRFPTDVLLYDHDSRQSAEPAAGTAVASLVGENFSRDGRYLALFGWDWDSSSRAQGFLLRRQLDTGTSEQFSLGPATGSALKDIVMDHSARFIAFSTVLGLVSADTNQLWDIYLLDFESSTLTLVTLNHERTAAGQADSRAPTISGDGRLVAFASDANDLVPGDTNNTADIFLFDRHTGKLTVASVNPDGTVGNARSSNPHLSPDRLSPGLHQLRQRLGVRRSQWPDRCLPDHRPSRADFGHGQRRNGGRVGDGAFRRTAGVAGGRSGSGRVHQSR